MVELIVFFGGLFMGDIFGILIMKIVNGSKIGRGDDEL